MTRILGKPRFVITIKDDLGNTYHVVFENRYYC